MGGKTLHRPVSGCSPASDSAGFVRTPVFPSGKADASEHAARPDEDRERFRGTWRNTGSFSPRSPRKDNPYPRLWMADAMWKLCCAPMKPWRAATGLKSVRSTFRCFAEAPYYLTGRIVTVFALHDPALAVHARATRFLSRQNSRFLKIAARVA